MHKRLITVGAAGLFLAILIAGLAYRSDCVARSDYDRATQLDAGLDDFYASIGEERNRKLAGAPPASSDQAYGLAGTVGFFSVCAIAAAAIRGRGGAH